MKRFLFLGTMFIIIALYMSVFAQAKIGDTKKELEKKKSKESENVPGSCTIFAASFGNTVLYGNNEDYNIPNTYYWVNPSGGGTYGGVYVGFDNLSPQGGINEKGLAFDYNALPKAS